MPVFDDEPLRRDAALPDVLKSRPRRDCRRLLDIGIGQHDEGIRATKFEHLFLQHPSGLAGDEAADIRRAGQGHGGDAWILDQAFHCARAHQQCAEQALGCACLTNTSSMASAHCGTLLACLRIAPLPAASAGARKRKNCQNG